MKPITDAQNTFYSLRSEQRSQPTRSAWLARPLPQTLILGCLLGCLSVSLLGCSRDNTVFEELAPKAPESIAPISTDGRAGLPVDFYDQSAGKATVSIQLDGAAAESKAIRFRTLPGANPIGSFNGAGQGNRAILGLGTWHGHALSSFHEIKWEAKIANGPFEVGVILQVDLACPPTGGSAVALETVSTALPPAVPTTDGYSESTAAASAAVWVANSGPIVDPDSGAVLLSNDSSSPKSLTALINAYPKACLKNAPSSASSLPRGLPLASVLWSLGDENNVSDSTAFVRSLKIGSDTFKDLE